MKPILRSQVLNGYRSNKPKGFYSALRGHTGVDLKYLYDEIPSPVTGHVIATKKQPEMGTVLYLQDLMGAVHVFAHLDSIKKDLGEKVIRGDIIARSGNSGSRTTAPHLHYEIITYKPINFIDKIMRRKELASVADGYNTDPILYLKNLYFKFHVDLDGNDLKTV